MRLAPTLRNDPEMAKKRIDGLDMPLGPDSLYLALLKTGYVPDHQTRTWPYEKNVSINHELDIVKEESDPEDGTDKSNKKIFLDGALVNAKVPRAKLLQFHENQRPAFWGTWTKKSQFVSGRYESLNLYFFFKSLIL